MCGEPLILPIIVHTVLEFLRWKDIGTQFSLVNPLAYVRDSRKREVLQEWEQDWTGPFSLSCAWDEDAKSVDLDRNIVWADSAKRVTVVVVGRDTRPRPHAAINFQAVLLSICLVQVQSWRATCLRVVVAITLLMLGYFHNLVPLNTSSSDFSSRFEQVISPELFSERSPGHLWTLGPRATGRVSEMWRADSLKSWTLDGFVDGFGCFFSFITMRKQEFKTSSRSCPGDSSDGFRTGFSGISASNPGDSWDSNQQMGCIVAYHASLVRYFLRQRYESGVLSCFVHPTCFLYGWKICGIYMENRSLSWLIYFHHPLLWILCKMRFNN